MESKLKAYEQPSSRLVAGVVATVIVHVLLFVALREHAFQHASERTVPRMALEVYLLPPPPPRAPESTETEPARTRREAEHHRPKPHSAPPSRLPSATPPPAIPPAPAQPSNAAPSPIIDPEAARAAIPGILKQLDNEKRKLPVGQLMDKPLYGPDEESRLGHQMARAARPDCMKDGRAGLLTPLFWLAEKKGTGCKW